MEVAILVNRSSNTWKRSPQHKQIATPPVITSIHLFLFIIAYSFSSSRNYILSQADMRRLSVAGTAVAAFALIWIFFDGVAAQACEAGTAR